MRALATFTNVPSSAAPAAPAAPAALAGPARARAGFSLVETLVALLIVVMISAIVATGVPAAINAYRNTVAGSNSQVVLATVTAALRDELGMARGVSLGDAQSDGTYSVNTYTCGEGYKATLTGALDDSGTRRGPLKTVADARMGSQDGQSWTLIPDAQIVSTQEDLYVQFSSITYDKSSKVFRVYDLKVVQVDGADEHVVARIGDSSESYFAVRAPSCTPDA